MNEREIHETEIVFQKLWTQAVGRKNYDKKDWLQVEKLIMELFRLKDVTI